MDATPRAPSAIVAPASDGVTPPIAQTAHGWAARTMAARPVSPIGGVDAGLDAVGKT
jgi:hypothetical protein